MLYASYGRAKSHNLYLHHASYGRAKSHNLHFPSWLFWRQNSAGWLKKFIARIWMFFNLHEFFIPYWKGFEGYFSEMWSFLTLHAILGVLGHVEWFKAWSEIRTFEKICGKRKFFHPTSRPNLRDNPCCFRALMKAFGVYYWNKKRNFKFDALWKFLSQTNFSRSENQGPTFFGFVFLPPSLNFRLCCSPDCFLDGITNHTQDRKWGDQIILHEW